MEAEPEIRRTYSKRLMLMGLGGLLWLVAGVFRAMGPGAFPTSLQWLAQAWLWIPLLVAPLAIWAWRCPACGAGVKLDGRTCSSCGRVLR
jgi:hypothetical protein